MDDHSAPTTKFKPPPLAMAVGVDADVATECEALLQITVIPFETAKEASSRLLLLRPLVVVAGKLDPAEVEELRTLCLDTAAELVTLPPKSGRLALELQAALRAARIQRQK